MTMFKELGETGDVGLICSSPVAVGTVGEDGGEISVSVAIVGVGSEEEL